MAGALRTKHGCWTCRLRRKKCDELRPNCAVCESYTISCYGYGAKPEWMNGGEKERAVISELRETVKQNSGRRKAAAQAANQRDRIVRIAPRALNDSVESSSSGLQSSHQLAVPPLDHELSQADAGQDEMGSSTSTGLNDQEVDGSILSIPADESILLMHFLDTVFPLQYPMYKPGILEGGRGWLHSLLLQTKPLYHSALAFSAYHRRTVLSAKLSSASQVATLVQQAKHFDICIKQVNDFSQDSCSKNGLGIAFAVVQLVFFQLFTGSGKAWQPHLRAATFMYQRGHKQNPGHFGMNDKPMTVTYEDLPISEQEATDAEQVATFKLLVGTLMWLDIMSAVTSGTARFLLGYHSTVLASDSQIKLENITGSRNWIMLQIGRIAALHEHKVQTLQQGRFDCWEFEQTVGDITREIQSGLTQVALEDFNISDCDPTETFCAASSNAVSDLTLFVTHSFAFMATLYLHLVAHGFQNLELQEGVVLAATRMFQTQISAQLLPALMAPLFVIGSVAKKEDEQYFRGIFSSPPLSDPSLKHRERIIPMLEEIWSRRRTEPGLSWSDIVELTSDILLL